MVALRDRSVNLLRTRPLGTVIGSRWAPLALIALIVVLGQRFDLETWVSKAFPSASVSADTARAGLIDDIWEIIKDLVDPDPGPEPQPTPPPEDDGGW